MSGFVTSDDRTTYAPHRTVSRAQMASFLVRTYELALGRQGGDAADAFADDDDSPHEANIDKAAAMGFAKGAGGDRFAPDGDVLRGQMA